MTKLINVIDKFHNPGENKDGEYVNFRLDYDYLIDTSLDNFKNRFSKIQDALLEHDIQYFVDFDKILSNIVFGDVRLLKQGREDGDFLEATKRAVLIYFSYNYESNSLYMFDISGNVYKIEAPAYTYSDFIQKSFSFAPVVFRYSLFKATPKYFLNAFSPKYAKNAKHNLLRELIRDNNTPSDFKEKLKSAYTKIRKQPDVNDSPSYEVINDVAQSLKTILSFLYKNYSDMETSTLQAGLRDLVSAYQMFKIVESQFYGFYDKDGEERPLVDFEPMLDKSYKSVRNSIETELLFRTNKREGISGSLQAVLDQINGNPSASTKQISLWISYLDGMLGKRPTEDEIIKKTIHSLRAALSSRG